MASANLMKEIAQKLEIPEPISYDLLMLDDDDLLVTHELQFLQENKETALNQFSRDTLWQDRHREEFQKHGLRWGHVGATPETKASPWFQLLLPREQDLVVFTLLTQPNAVSLDVSQSIGRHRVTTDAKLSGTVTPGEKRYLMDRHRFRVAPEALASQAIPWQNLDMSFDPSVLRSLAGNAWTGTVAMAVFFSIAVVLPWPEVDATAPLEHREILD